MNVRPLNSTTNLKMVMKKKSFRANVEVKRASPRRSHQRRPTKRPQISKKKRLKTGLADKFTRS